MSERNLWSKLGLIVLILGLGLWECYPPKERLKPGIDLGGGHSLLFEIDDSDVPDWQKPGLAEEVMNILKQRVDPGSTRNLVWRPIGWNRLEIQMPRPTAEQAKYRQDFEQARGKLVDTNITEVQTRNALSLPADQRQAAFDRLIKGVPARKALFDKLVEAEEEYRRLQAAVESQQAESAPATQAATTRPISPELARKVDEAFLARRTAVEDIMKTNIEVRVLADILALDHKSRIRSERLTKFKDEHPDRKGLVEEIIARFDAYAKERGSLDDPSDLMRLLRGAGMLEFRILAQPDPSNPGRIQATKAEYREDIKKYLDQLVKFGPRPREGDNFQWFKISKPEENDITKGGFIVGEYLGNPYVLSFAGEDMGLINKGDNAWTLRGASEDIDEVGRPAVSFELDGRGGNRFEELTASNIGRPLCIFLDNEAMSAATIQSKIRERGRITGTFSRQDVSRLINVLNAGVLPGRLKETPLQVKSVGPSLGEANRTNGMKAVVYAFLLTVLFMAVYYNYNGVIADIALLMNLVITLGVMSFIQATFTLPGIAGLVLTLGMAVDANVLIFERMREELDRGVSARMAVKLGYERAFSAILDSNVTTIITAVILVAIGSEEIKGFGLTLGIGLTCSLFTALFVTRQYFNVMTPSSLDSLETRKVGLGTVVLALIGGAFLATGYIFNKTPADRDDSVLMGFAHFFLMMAGTAVFLIFTLFLFRFMYRTVGHQKAGRLPMLRLMSTPNINWMGIYKKFWVLSAVIIGAGFIFMFSVDKNQVLDIEFLGGTSVQIQVREERAAEFAARADEKLLEYIRGKSEEADSSAGTVGWLRFAAGEIEKAAATPHGDSTFLLSGYDSRLTFPQMEALLMPVLGSYVVRGGITRADEGVLVQFNPDKVKDLVTDAASAQTLVRKAGIYVRDAADRFRNTRVQLVQEETAGGEVRSAFEIIVAETQSGLVAEALRASLQDILKVTQPIDAQIVRTPERAPDGLFPIRQSDNTLSEVIGGDTSDSIADFKGGVVLVFDEINPPASAEDVEQRLKDMRLQPDFQDVAGRGNIKVIPLATVPSEQPGGKPLMKKFAIAVSEPSLPYVEGEDNARWRGDFAEREQALAKTALASSRALDRVTQFAAQVAGEAVQAAVIAIILSFVAIAVYLWIRFGSVDFGLCGIIALYHDVAVTLACTMASHFVYNTVVGQALLLADFKVDLTLVAALLTIVGFSINDTIVIFDRIRENRGRMPVISPSLINDSLNQTLSRTIITSLTVLMTVVVMYVVGGEGIHGFAFAMIIGSLSGVYSTLAIAAPLLRHPRVMWVITVVLAALTAALIVSMISMHPTVKAVIYAIITLLGLWLLVRQWRAMATGGVVREAPATA